MKLSLQLDNASYRHDDGSLDFGEVSETLHALSVKVEEGETDLGVLDYNGNLVGSLYITPKPAIYLPSTNA